MWWVDLLLTAIMGAVGACSGALAAFALERKQTQQDEQRRQYSALLKVAFQLSNCANLFNIRHRILTKELGSEAKDPVPILLQRPNIALDLDFSELVFLLEREPDLLLEISSANNDSYWILDLMDCTNSMAKKWTASEHLSSLAENEIKKELLYMQRLSLLRMEEASKNNEVIVNRINVTILDWFPDRKTLPPFPESKVD